MEVSRSVPEFVEKWVCLHTPISNTMKATMRQDLKRLLWHAMDQAIDMYREYIEKHGEEPVVAKAKACLEIADGLDVEV